MSPFASTFIILFSSLLFFLTTHSRVRAATNLKNGREVLPNYDTDNVVAESPHVLLLFDDNFEKEIAKYEYALVQFYAPWSGHDVPLARHLSNMADDIAAQTKTTSSSHVDKKTGKKTYLKAVAKIFQIAGVYGNDELAKPTKMAQKYGVENYPSLKLFKAGKFVENYRGPRSRDHMLTYWKEKIFGREAKK